MKKLLATLLITALASQTVLASDVVVQQNNTTVTVDGQQIKEPILVYNGTTYVPIRAVSDTMGAQVGYNAETKQVNINSGKDAINTLVNDLLAVNIVGTSLMSHGSGLSNLNELVADVSDYSSSNGNNDDIIERINIYTEHITNYKQICTEYIDKFKTFFPGVPYIQDYLSDCVNQCDNQLLAIELLSNSLNSSSYNANEAKIQECLKNTATFSVTTQQYLGEIREYLYYLL